MKRKLSVLLSLCLILTLVLGTLSPVNATKVGSGSITFTPSTVACGDPITMIVTPDPGCALQSILVTNTAGAVIPLTDNKNGTYTFIVPEGGIAVQAEFRVLGDGEPVDEKPVFSDVIPDAYYAPAVTWAVDNGITTGINETTFGPEEACTRAQVVTFLWRLAGCPEVASDASFSDVVPGDYYEKAVKWAVAVKITNGMGDDTFAPNAICTRGQIVTFLARYANGSPSSTDNPFTDVQSDAYYSVAVLWALENGITTGATSTSFAPDKSCTRAQVVTFLFRMAE